MYHSITFGEKNTWDDWHLIPSSRPVFSPPKPDIRLIQIPGKSGSLDVTEIMGKQVVYADRTGSFEFHVDHNYWDSWIECYQEVTNYLHGNRMTAYMEDDQEFYYEGRFSVNEWRSNANFSSIVIEYVVAPYKFARYEYGDDWLWDPFNFETDKINLLTDVEIVPGGTTIELQGYGYRTIPTIECSDEGVILYFDNYETPIYLVKGENRPSLAVITEGLHRLRFVGEGTVSIHYRGGSL